MASDVEAFNRGSRSHMGRIQEDRARVIILVGLARATLSKNSSIILASPARKPNRDLYARVERQKVNENLGGKIFFSQLPRRWEGAFRRLYQISLERSSPSNSKHVTHVFVAFYRATYIFTVRSQCCLRFS